MRKLLATVSILFILLMPSCAARAPATLSSYQSTPPQSSILLTPVTTYTVVPLPQVPTPTLACTDGLTFVEDETIPDDTVVPPNSPLDKQWRVQNSGTCNWDNHYRLRLVSGDSLGAATEQALYPARAGSEATIQVGFTAPSEPGEYISEWQAFDSKNIPFGDSFYMKITVSP